MSNLRIIEMKRIAYLMMLFGLIVFVGAIINMETDWVQLMFGAFLCVLTCFDAVNFGTQLKYSLKFKLYVNWVPKT